MKQSQFRIEKIEQMKKKVIKLYRQGYGTRPIANLLQEQDGFKRSHEWVRTVVKGISPIK